MTLPSFGDTVNWIRIRDDADRADVIRFLSRAVAMDEATPVRIVAGGGGVRLWARTPFGPQITRLFVGDASAADQVTLAHSLMHAAGNPDPDGHIDLGYLMPSAWQGILPPDSGFVLREMFRAQDLIDLSERARSVAAEQSGPAGIAPSLLDQEVISIEEPISTNVENNATLTVPMRTIFALTSAGFIPVKNGRTPAGEKVRLSTKGPWLRLDARFGSVFWRPETLSLSLA